MDDPNDSVVERTIATMRDAIRDGRYVQGQRLVVADVTKALGVSAGPVREAIRRLTGEGLVEITQHRGATVRTFKRKDVREIYQLREVVEGLAARLAAEHIDIGNNAAELKASVAEMRTIVRNHGRNYYQHNRDFHELIYKIADNEAMRQMARQLVLPIYKLQFHSLLSPEYYRVSASEHEAIAQAILDGDGPGAERLMRNHVRNSGAAGPTPPPANAGSIEGIG